MSREIKFRARNAGVPRCWVYGYLVVESGVHYIVNGDGKFLILVGTEAQFTGLKDKDGREIYEGDIVENTTQVTKNPWVLDPCTFEYEYTTTRDVVKFDGHWCAFSFTSRNERGELEVIGNIHEHSELLEAGE